MIPRLSFLFLLISIHSMAQIDFKVTHEEVDNGINLYAVNNEYCPVSLQLNLNLENMRPLQPLGDLYVIDARTEKKFLVRLEPVDTSKGFQFSYDTKYHRGNHLLESYDKDYAYSLPFQKGESHKIFQGYNGNISHQKQYALDFEMPVGTPVTAIREGYVIEVVDHNDQSCPEEKCQKFNNKIVVYHSDGTFASYAHLQKDGALVKVGDKVLQDQIIGKSGNTGWSTGPHLHTIVYQQRMTYRASLSTQFKIDDGSQTEVLKEGKTYSKNY